MNSFCCCFENQIEVLRFDSPEEFQLFQAVDENNVTMFNNLLTQDVSINAVEHEFNHSLIHWACENGSWQMVKMITRHPKLNQSNMGLLDKFGDNCLTLAVFGGSLEVVQHLVNEYEMDINNNATTQRPILWAIDYRRPAIFSYFISKNTEVNFIIKGTSTPFLSWIIGQLGKRGGSRADKKELKIYIKTVLTSSISSHRLDIDAVDEYGNTALCYAVALKDLLLVSLLCDYNAKANCYINNSRITLLDYAIAYGLTEICQILKAHSAGECTTRVSCWSTKIEIISPDVYIKYGPRPEPQLWLHLNEID